MVDPAPSHVRDVQQTVNTAQIHERTVIGDVLDDAVHDIAFGQLADDFCALFGTAFFQDGATGHNDVPPAAIHFQDLERLSHSHQWADITHRAHIDLRSWQERNCTAQIDGEATFDPAKDRAFDAFLFVVGFFQAVPGFLAPRFVAADHRLAFGVFHAFEENLDGVADCNLGRLARGCEFFQFDTAFNFEAYIDDGLAIFHRDHGAFDNRTFFGGVVFEALCEQGLEIFHGCHC